MEITVNFYINQIYKLGTENIVNRCSEIKLDN